MKYSAFFLLVFIQISAKSQISFGIKYGINLTSVKYEESTSEKLMKPYKKIKFGLLFGGEAEIKINRVLVLDIDLIYTQKGLKYSQPGYSEGKIKMNYVEMPFAGKYLIGSPKKNPFGIFVGGYFAYWLNGKYLKTDFKTGSKQNEAVDFNSPDHQYNRTDIGFYTGISKKISRRWIFDLRYTHGMFSSARNGTDALLSRVVSLSVTYRLNKK
jgi:hypothetical protein